MSWALSSLQMKKYHDNLALYTDSVSARILIDELKLPYDDVFCDLDGLDKTHAGLWALPKIYAYSKQEEPFLHVDGDIFIWKPFSEKVLSGELIAQNVEVATDYYENIMTSLEENLVFFPDEILCERKQNDKIYAYNAGILGGSDICFFKEYTAKANEFIHRNIARFDRIKVSDFNVFYEQYLFYCMALQQRKPVSVLLPEIRGGNEYLGFGDFPEVPHNRHFLHLLGSFKTNKQVCEQMANRLRLDYPEHYYRIIALFKRRQIPLKKNYYQFAEATEQDLVQRHAILKRKFGENKLTITEKNTSPRTFARDYSLTKLVKNAIKKIIEDQDHYPGITADYFRVYLEDVSFFEENIFSVLTEKFAGYSDRYLYARDISHTEYFGYIFADPKMGYQMKLITDRGYHILESRFDWSEIDSDAFGQMVLMEQMELPPSKYFTAVIPECESTGFRLLNVDELDIRILEIFAETATVNELLNALRSDFDDADLEASEQEFEILITGRIKVAIMNKLLKTVTV
jgi:hypothetical protein